MDYKGHIYRWKSGPKGPISDENEYLTIEAFWGMEFWFLKFVNFIKDLILVLQFLLLLVDLGENDEIFKPKFDA